MNAKGKAKERPVCTVCGSVNVRADASGSWNEATQAWELLTTYDNSDCDDCGGECSLKWVPVDNRADALYDCTCCSWSGLWSHLNAGSCPICNEPTEAKEPPPVDYTPRLFTLSAAAHVGAWMPGSVTRACNRTYWSPDEADTAAAKLRRFASVESVDVSEWGKK